MAVSSASRHNVVLLIFLVGGQLLLVTFGLRNDGGSTLLESLVMRATSPVVAAAQWAAGSVAGARDGFGELVTARSKSRDLEAEVARLREELRASREAVGENRRLRDLLELTDSVERAVPARVVTTNLGNRARVIVIDRGSSDGVRLNQPVIAWGGAVGKVLASSPGYSKVRLITDPNSGVGGVVQRSREMGAVEGTYDANELDMRYVPRFADVMHGDRVVTSGQDGIFPRGYGIGRIVAIHDSPATGTQTIRLEPELDYAALEEVLVLLDPMPAEQEGIAP